MSISSIALSDLNKELNQLLEFCLTYQKTKNKTIIVLPIISYLVIEDTTTVLFITSCSAIEDQTILMIILASANNLELF